MRGVPKTAADLVGRTVCDIRVWVNILTPVERNLDADAQAALHECALQAIALGTVLDS